MTGGELIGIDLGGTKIEVAVLNGDGQFLLRERVPTPRHDYPATLAAVAGLVARTTAYTQASTPVGLGIPGTISPATGKIKNANATWLNGQQLDVDLAQVLQRPVRLQNDANCLAVSEAIDGAGAHAQVVFAVILGTGVGGGVTVGRQILTGANAIAGEWGHNPLPWPRPAELPGPRCWCGQLGCIETWLCGPALAELVGELGPEAAHQRYFDRLGRALATVINLLDPQVIVIGGGVSNLPGLAGAVAEVLPDYVRSDQVTTRIAIAKHGDSSGVRGAAWLWR